MVKIKSTMTKCAIQNKRVSLGNAYKDAYWNRTYIYS